MLHSFSTEQAKVASILATHNHVTSHVFVWSSFLTQTIQVTFATPGTVVVNLGDQGGHILQGHVTSHGAFERLLSPLIRPPLGIIALRVPK
jgi:hypothetical protein